MVKKLRFYARFIVVCLLLKKMKLVRDLVRVSALVHTFYPSDGDKDAYGICTHGLLVGTHGNFKLNAYRVNIEI